MKPKLTAKEALKLAQRLIDCRAAYITRYLEEEKADLKARRRMKEKYNMLVDLRSLMTVKALQEILAEWDGPRATRHRYWTKKEDAAR